MDTFRVCVIICSIFFVNWIIRGDIAELKEAVEVHCGSVSSAED